MRQNHQSFAPIELERMLLAVLGLLIADGEELRSPTARRAETALAQAGLTDAEIGAVTGGDSTEVRTILDRDRPVDVLARARAHMTRSAT